MGTREDEEEQKLPPQKDPSKDPYSRRSQRPRGLGVIEVELTHHPSRARPQNCTCIVNRA